MTFFPETEQNWPAHDAPTMVQWVQWPVRFRIASEDAELMSRAKDVLGPWLMPAPPHSAAAPIDIDMHASLESGDWLLRIGGRAQGVYADRDALLRGAEIHAVHTLLDLTDRLLTLHAALLHKDGRGLIIAGPSRTGKSTLACALWANGWTLLSDDITLIDWERGEACPLLRRVSVRETSRAVLGDEFWRKMVTAPSTDKLADGYMFHPQDFSGEPRGLTVKVSAILFLSRLRAPALSPATFQSVRPIDSLMALVAYSNCAYRGEPGLAFSRLGSVSDRVPGYDFARGDIAAMINAVNSIPELAS